MIIGQRVRYIGPRKDRHGFHIDYTTGLVVRDDDNDVTVKLDDNDGFAQAWAGHVAVFGRRWTPIRFSAQIESYNMRETVGPLKGTHIGTGWNVTRYVTNGCRLHVMHDFERDENGARARAAALNEDPAFQLFLPPGYPDPTMPHRLIDFEHRHLVALGYTEEEAWTLYFSQRARVVADPLSPHAGIIAAKNASNIRLTPRERAWIDERIILRKDLALCMTMDIFEGAGRPAEEVQAELAAGELGQAALRTAGRIW